MWERELRQVCSSASEQRDRRRRETEGIALFKEIPKAMSQYKELSPDKRVHNGERCMEELWTASLTWSTQPDSLPAVAEPFTVTIGDVWLIDVKPVDKGRQEPDAREEYWCLVKGMVRKDVYIIQDPDHLSQPTRIHNEINTHTHTRRTSSKRPRLRKSRKTASY